MKKGITILFIAIVSFYTLQKASHAATDTIKEALSKYISETMTLNDDGIWNINDCRLHKRYSDSSNFLIIDLENIYSTYNGYVNPNWKYVVDIKCIDGLACMGWSDDLTYKFTNTSLGFESEFAGKSIVSAINLYKKICIGNSLSEKDRKNISEIIGVGVANKDDQFLLAVRGGDYSKATELLKEGANVNADGILEHAYCVQNFELIEWLLKNGADPNYQNDSGSTIMHLAAMSDSDFSVKIASLLLSYGASINLPNNEGFTPEYYAKKINNRNVLSLWTKAVGKFVVGDIAYVCSESLFGESNMCKTEVLNIRGNKIQVLYLTPCTSVIHKNNVEWVDIKSAGTLQEVQDGHKCQ